MKICKDGRIWGQNNKEAGVHLGIPKKEKPNYDGQGYNKGNNNPAFGNSHRGELNPNWRGGITSMANRIRHTIEYRLWREAVYARDSWTCQECGRQGVRLHPHHIKSFALCPELRFAIDNGQTLCIDCHKLTENYGGRSKVQNAEIRRDKRDSKGIERSPE